MRTLINATEGIRRCQSHHAALLLSHDKMAGRTDRRQKTRGVWVRSALGSASGGRARRDRELVFIRRQIRQDTV
jgi:hypothetical protein